VIYLSPPNELIELVEIEILSLFVCVCVSMCACVCVSVLTRLRPNILKTARDIHSDIMEHLWDIANGKLTGHVVKIHLP